MGEWFLSFVFAHAQPPYTLAVLTCFLFSSLIQVHCHRWLSCVHWQRLTQMPTFQPCLPTQHHRRQLLLQLQRCCRRSLGKLLGRAMLTMPSASAAPQAQTGSHPWKAFVLQQNGYLCVSYCTACHERLWKHCCARPALEYQIGLRQSHVTSWAIRDTYTARYIKVSG